MKCLFNERNNYKYLTNSDKTKWGFIVNRMLAKKHPKYAQKLNVRSGDFSMVLDLWWVYLGTRNDKYYHSWIWVSGSKKSKIDKKTIELVSERFPFITVSDIEYLHEHHSDIFKEEVKYYKKLKEDYGV
jgi:hypothetical protein